MSHRINKQNMWVFCFSWHFHSPSRFGYSHHVISQDSHGCQEVISAPAPPMPFGYFFCPCRWEVIWRLRRRLDLEKTQENIFCCQNLKRILSATFWQQSLEEYKERCKHKTGSFDWDKLRKMKTAAWRDMYKDETLYGCICIYVYISQLYIFEISTFAKKLS